MQYVEYGKLTRLIPVLAWCLAEERDPEQIETLLRKRFQDLKTVPGHLAVQAEWERLGGEDPRMDDLERTLFPEETYRCSACGNKEYFGSGCQRTRFCRMCGAQMRNAEGRRRGN